MKLTYHPAAEAEVVAAARFYERAVSGLGGQFLDEFDRSIDRILPHRNAGESSKTTSGAT